MNMKQAILYLLIRKYSRNSVKLIAGTLYCLSALLSANESKYYGVFRRFYYNSLFIVIACFNRHRVNLSYLVLRISPIAQASSKKYSEYHSYILCHDRTKKLKSLDLSTKLCDGNLR